MKKAISMLLALAMALSLPLAAHCEGTAGGTNDTALTTLSDGGLSAGVQTENSYWNDAMSIGCTFGSNWYFYTDEEIAEQNGLATGMLREDYAKLVEESGSMMDMLAVNTETGENVNITLQRLSLTDALVLDEQKYAEISAEPLVEALEQTGLENVSTSVDEVEFLGEKHPCVRVKALIQDMDFFETLVIVKTGRTVCVVTVACFLEDTTKEVLANFYGEKP